MPRKRIEVGVAVENRHVDPDGQCGDETIDEYPHGFALTAALPVERGGPIEVAGLQRNERGACDEPSEVPPVLLVPGSGQELHSDDVARGEVGAEQLSDSNTRRGTGVA